MTATKPFCVFALSAAQQGSHIQSFLSIAQSVVLFLKTNSSRRRHKHQIVAELLEVAKDGRNKTCLMYKARLSFSQLNDYLELLLNDGLLECVPVKKNRKGREIYRSTDKGIRYLKAYRIIDSLLTV